MTPSSNQQYKGPKLAPTPVSDHQYTGLTLDPEQRGNLAFYGSLIPSSGSSRHLHNRGDIQAANPLTTLRKARRSSALGHHHESFSINKIGRDMSTRAGTNDSPFSSEAEIHPSSGVPLNQSDNTMPTTTLPQNASFPQFSQHKGIHDWNNSVFDDRWLLQPGETWNTAARRESVITVSPERQGVNRNASHTSDQVGSRTDGSRRPSSQNPHMQRLALEAEEKRKELRSRQVSTAPTETREGDNVDTLATSGNLGAGRKGNHTNQ